jgi:hypothetical protein
MDRLRDGAAVIYLEGTYDRRKPAPSPAWTADSPPLGNGITTSRVDANPRVTISTIVLVDPIKYVNLLRLNPTLQFCREDEPGIYKLVHPDTEEGQGGQWVPMVEMPKPWRSGTIVQGIWHVVLNVSPLESHRVDYLNEDRFDLRAVNLRLVES